MKQYLPLLIYGIVVLVILIVVYFPVPKPEKNVLEREKNIDFVVKYGDSFDSTDSLIHFFAKEMDAKQKRDENEILYLRTGNDKYRIIGNRYVDSVHYWYLKLQKVSKIHNQ